MSKQGPNVRKLIAHRIAVLAVPSGGGLKSVVETFLTPGKLAELAKQATLEIEYSLEAVKAASDNPYGNDDEKIAEAILKQVSERRKK